MTKKDYVKIAETLATYWQTSSDNGERISLYHFLNLVDSFCYMFKDDNYRFDEDKFKTYITKNTNRAIDFTA